MFKLLIVDDEEIERRAIEHIINTGTMNISETEQASNGQEAIAVASTFDPDIIIMDITMPGLDGIKAASIIKKFLPDTHIIFLTAFDEFDYAKEALKLGADDFLVKPASPETIETTISSSINRIQQKKEQQHKNQLTKEKLKGASKYLEECFVKALIDGESDEKKINKYLSFINIDFDFSFGSVISIQFEKPNLYTSDILDIKKYKIFEKLAAQLSSSINKSILYFEGFYLYLFVFANSFENISKSRSMLGGIAENIKKEIYEEHKVVINLGVGDICKSVDTIWNSFMQAKEMIIKKYDANHNNISLSLIETLAQSIVDIDRHVGKSQINRIQKILLKECEDIEKCRIRLLEFSIMLKQVIANKVHRPISIDDSLYLAISKIESAEEGAEYLEYYVEKLRKISSVDEQDKNAIILNKIAMYIEEHISENITLEHLSEISKLSSFYLCKLFKKYLKMNFVDYLTFVRIKKSKNLLSDPYLSVKEICFECGYTDPNYFARVFKRETGMSPSRYRRQHVEADN